MTAKKIHLTSKNHIFTDAGADMRYNKPRHEFPLHDHEFHEIVYISNGNAKHYINGRVLPLSTGDLLFIRSTDIHTYSDFCGETFEYYTLLFETEILHAMLSFFGMEKAEKGILSSELPKAISLDKKQAEAMDSRFSELFLIMHNDICAFKTASRMLISELFSKYFTKEDTYREELPLWLEYACEKMRLPKNFTVGTERFFEICGRKREHCTRTMKKYLGTTPNRYILDLRMKYAASLLSSGDMTVSEVALECGYNSLPHFHSLFSEAFGMSPGEYKKQNGKIT